MGITQGKLDLAKLYKNYYTALHTPHLVEIDEAPFLAITGKGSPGGGVFTEATEALYTLGYGIKGLCKKDGQDFTVAKLEGLRRVDGNREPLEVRREEWLWKLLIRLPDFVAPQRVEEARAAALVKKKDLLPLRNVVFDTLNEGLCVQMMHIGPYAAEPDTIAQIRKYMKERRLVSNGLPHEIYLSDPRKTAPAAMKAILRFPVKQAKQ